MSDKERINEECNEREEVVMQDLLSRVGIETKKVVKRLPIEEIMTYSSGKHKIEHLYMLEDDNLLYIEFQTSASVEDLLLIAQCYVSLCQTYQKKIKIVVLFDSDIQEEDAITDIDLGAVKFRVEPIFLSKFNNDEVAKIKQLIEIRNDPASELKW